MLNQLSPNFLHSFLYPQDIAWPCYMREEIKPSEPFYWWSQVLWFLPILPNLYFLLVHCSLLPVFVIFLGVEFFFVLSVWPLACVDRRLTEMGCLEVALVGKRWFLLQPSFALGRWFFTLPIFASPRTRAYRPTRGNSTIWFYFFIKVFQFSSPGLGVHLSWKGHII